MRKWKIGNKEQEDKSDKSLVLLAFNAKLKLTTYEHGHRLIKSQISALMNS